MFENSPENPTERSYKTNRSLRFAKIALATIAFVAGLATIGSAQISNEDCQKCHGDLKIASMRPESLVAMVRVRSEESAVLRSPQEVGALYISEDRFLKSVHAGLKCADCHQGIERLPHNQRLPRLTCADCHTDVEEDIKSGPHSPAIQNGRLRPTCASCHGPAHEITLAKGTRDYGQAKKIVEACEHCHNKPGTRGFIPAESYRENIHGVALFKKGLPITATCVDCHGAHKMLPALNPSSPISPLKVPETCGKCHEGVAEIYITSVHGQHLLKGETNAATCTSCHHSHGIQAVGEPFLLAVVQECSHCHLDLGASYLRSYHGKATHLGYGSAAVCSSCHGSHDILPKSDPRSRVAKANLVATCSKCHLDANANFVKYIPHVNYLDRKASAPVFYTFWGMTILLLSVLALFISHTLLWFQRTLLDRLKNPQGHHGRAERERMISRFRPVHRWTHFLIIVSFMGLVATGFPLKYSYTEWAKQFTNLFGGIHVMGILHRILALITFTYAAVHIGFLFYYFVKECPRPRRKYLFGPDSLLFSWRDFKEFLAMARWFFWLGPRPKFDRWTYFEKFDYWGEIWGVIIIGGSGLMLWMPTQFTRWLPGWVLNCAMVIHSIEALLAASVIFLVHFFNTHLRPEKFPVDMVMLTGQMSETEMKEERPAEYERIVAAGLLEKRTVEPVALKWRVLGTVAGIAAFLTGIALIILALKTELGQFF